MLHLEQSKLAGQTINLKEGHQFQPGQQFTVIDWWDRVSGKSWKASDATGIAGVYAWRAGEVFGLHFKEGHPYYIPPDDEVLFGKINGVDGLVNICELDLDNVA